MITNMPPGDQHKQEKSMQFKESKLKVGIWGTIAFGTICVAAQSASANLSGFGTGSNLTLTGYAQDGSGNIINTTPPSISGGALTLTTPFSGEAAAAFFNTPQYMGEFVTTFIFQNTNSVAGSSDGFSVVFQNDSRGASAIGGGGAGLGYGLQNNNQPPTGPALTAIAPSAALEFYLRNGHGATEFETGGNAVFNDANSTQTVDLVDGDPILVTLVYDGSTLTEFLQDQLVPADVYIHGFAVNIPTAVGGSTALVGFTGGTGGGYSNQTITAFTFTNVPEPSSLTMLGLGVAGALRRRRFNIRANS